MATKRWKGAAAAVAQVNTITPASVGVGNTFTVTINGKSVTYTAAAATVSDVVTGLTALLQASEHPEFLEVSWAANAAGTAITATARRAGTPFTQTSSAAGGTATLTTVTTTANSSPNDWANAANWDPAGVPVTGDDVYLDATSIDVKYGLSQSGVTLNSLTVSASFAPGAFGDGTIGLPEVNAEGSGAYLEYRPQYLAIGATTVSIGRGPGSGSGRIKLNTGAAQTTLTVYGSGSPEEDGLPAVIWKGTHASNAVNVFGGSFGAAVFGGEAATIATLRVGPDAGRSPADVRCGAGVTLTTLVQASGTVELGAGLTTVTKTGGELTVLAGNVTTLNEQGGTTHYQGAGTIGTLTVDQGGAVDFEQVGLARTVTSCTLHAGGAIADRYGTVTWSNPVTFSRCKPFEEAQLALRENVTLTVTLL